MRDEDVVRQMTTLADRLSIREVYSMNGDWVGSTIPRYNPEHLGMTDMPATAALQHRQSHDRERECVKHQTLLNLS